MSSSPAAGAPGCRGDRGRPRRRPHCPRRSDRPPGWSVHQSTIRNLLTYYGLYTLGTETRQAVRGVAEEVVPANHLERTPVDGNVALGAWGVQWHDRTNYASSFAPPPDDAAYEFPLRRLISKAPPTCSPPAAPPMAIGEPAQPALHGMEFATGQAAGVAAAWLADRRGSGNRRAVAAETAGGIDRQGRSGADACAGTIPSWPGLGTLRGAGRGPATRCRWRADAGSRRPTETNSPWSKNDISPRVANVRLEKLHQPRLTHRGGNEIGE